MLAFFCCLRCCANGWTQLTFPLGVHCWGKVCEPPCMTRFPLLASLQQFQSWRME